MKKKMMAVVLMVALALCMFAGCGNTKDADTGKGEQPTEENELYTLGKDSEEPESSQAVPTESVQIAEADPSLSEEELVTRIEQMQQTVETDLQTQKITAETIEEQLRQIDLYSADPCLNNSVTQITSYAAMYLYTIGKDKAPDHAVTKLGENLYAYITAIAVNHESIYSEAAETSLDAFDEIIMERFGDEDVIADLAAEFYELVN